MIEYTNSQIERIVDEHIHSQRDRDVLKSRYIDGLTYEQLGEKYDLTDRQVKNSVYKHQDTLLRYLST